MPYFTVEQLRECMDHQDRIRNMSVIAHVDHGKSTLTDSLIARAGIISLGAAGNTRFTDTRQDEKDRCITIKSTGVSLYYEWVDESASIEAAAKQREADKAAGKEVKEEVEEKPEEKVEAKAEVPEGERVPDKVDMTNGYLINLIDSPGHVDFSSEVTAALRVTDGALVVVDCAEGVCVQTETVLRQALSERVIPCLMLNKVDRVIMELKLSGEEAYRMFEKTIGQVNELITTYQDKTLFSNPAYKTIFADKGIRDLCVDPSRGNVAFGSGLHGWGFTVAHFARLYTKKFGGELSSWMNNLWGNRFLNAKTNKWTNKSQADDGSMNSRGFALYIMDPINQLFEAVLSDQTKKYKKMLKTLGVKLTVDDELETGKKLLKTIMQKFLPAADALLEMIIMHLPSPAAAQKYRVDTLYTGPLDDEAANAIRNCDPNGPLMLYVSKMVPTVDKSRFFAFGRVFSGKVSTGQKVHIFGPDYKPGKKDDLFIKNIQRTVLMMGSRIEQIDDCPCGNTIGLVGVDQYIVKTGTITTCETAHSIKPMKFSVSPVVRVAVEPENPKDLPKLLDGMKRLDKSDPCVLCIVDKDNNQNIIAGAGELHLEICLKDLKEDFCNNMNIIVSDPIVGYRETISAPSARTVMAKSVNKHNRLYFDAVPVSEEVQDAILKGTIERDQDPKIRARLMADNYGWDVEEARKIWSFGPEGSTPGTNILLEATKGVQYLNEIKDHVNSGFQIVCKNGVLAGEELVGACFKLVDCTLHPDAIHRGAGQITPTARSVLYAACLVSKPVLMEPFYLVDILAPDSVMGGIYSTMSKRRGLVISEEPREGQPLVEVKAHLPVGESFGFDADLRGATGGQAFPQCVFDHYAAIPSDPLQAGSQANQILLSIRKRKGMKEVTPDVADYEDKL